jgi:hypothetical protein
MAKNKKPAAKANYALMALELPVKKSIAFQFKFKTQKPGKTSKTHLINITLAVGCFIDSLRRVFKMEQ